MGDGRPTALLKAAAAPPAAVSADMDVEATGVVRADTAPSPISGRTIQRRTASGAQFRLQERLSASRINEDCWVNLA